MSVVKDLQRVCEFHQIELVDKGNGHYQICGPLLVNYYPLSKRRTAYVAGTTEGRAGVDPNQAVKMCYSAPKGGGKKANRSGNNLRRKRHLWYKKKVRNCHWCEIPLTLKPNCRQTATLEHIIPLARGGLNNLNNMTLACEPCNRERGSDMPELTSSK